MQKTGSDNISRIAVLLLVAILGLPFAMRFPALYAGRFAPLKAEIEERFSYLPQETFFEGLFWDYCRATKRRYINGVIILNDDRLVLEVQRDPAILAEKARGVIELNEYLKAKGTPFLFLRAPDGALDSSQLPRSFEDIAATDGAWFVATLREGGVDVLDFRELMASKHFDFSIAFFRGDPHWTPPAALWAFGETAAHMNSKYGFAMDEKTWDPQEYEALIYDKAFHGSLANRIGDQRKEDFTVLIPRFPTDYSVLARAEGEVLATGDYVNVFVPWTQSGDSDDVDLNAMRGAPIKEFHNLAVGGQKRILFVSDSFGDPFVTYLATALEYVDYLYLNYEENKNLYPLLDSEEYDLVIFLASDLLILGLNEEGYPYEYTRMYFGKN